MTWFDKKIEFFETIKTGAGLKRGEIEIELSRKQFKAIWPAARGRRLEKIRYTLKWRRIKIELDVYKKDLAGLKVVEVEFKSRKQASDFSPPPWFGREVTGEDEYKNQCSRSKTDEMSCHRLGPCTQPTAASGGSGDAIKLLHEEV